MFWLARPDLRSAKMARLPRQSGMPGVRFLTASQRRGMLSSRGAEEVVVPCCRWLVREMGVWLGS